MNAERNSSSFKTPLLQNHRVFEMKVSFQIFWPWVSVFNGTTRMCTYVVPTLSKLRQMAVGRLAASVNGT